MAHNRQKAPGGKEQKRELIAELIKATPEKSDRQIAERVKASPTTVGAVPAAAEEIGVSYKTLIVARTAAWSSRHMRLSVAIEAAEE
jgi:hypothetical protein